MHHTMKCSVVVATILIFSIGCCGQKMESKAFIGKPMEGFPASPESQVTLSNCTRPPYNAWTFRNAGILPSLMVARGGAIHSFAKNPVSGLNNLLIKYKGHKKTLFEVLNDDKTDGIVVLKDGEIVHEEYFGDFTEDHYHMWASSTKSLVGMCAGILASQDEFDFDINEKVETYAPTLKGSGFEGLTVRQVLNMVAALEYTEEYVELREGMVEYEYFRRTGFIPAPDLMMLDPRKDPTTPRGLLSFIARIQRNPDHTPGEILEYQSPNVDAIALIISKVSGLSLEEYISNHIWRKLQPEHDAFIVTDIAFNPVATGGFNSTLRDFARFGLAIMNDGMFEGKQIIPAEWIEQTYQLTDADVKACQNSVFKDAFLTCYDDKLSGYKNFWWIHDSKKKIMMARGIFGQGLYIDKSNNVVIATFASAPTPSNIKRDTWKIKVHAMQMIAEHLSD